MGTLFLVATPIGNLGDMSRRAIETLRDVDLIAAEDTRHTRKLLTHFEIRNRLVSYHEFSKAAALDSILQALDEGDAALVSDAGTPGINDPGYRLVQSAIAQGHIVTTVPGPSAPIAALVASGLPADSFLYLGYLPRKSRERRDVLTANADQPHTLIFLETPHRLVAALSDLADILGDRQAVVARELTKLHEEYVRGSLRELRDHFGRHQPRGEMTLVIAGAASVDETWSEEEVIEAIALGLTEGEAASSLAKRLAGISGWPRRKIYRLVQGQQNMEEKEL